MTKEELKEKTFQLRNEMGFGLMDCRKALERNDYDMERAKDYLRKNAWKQNILVNIKNIEDESK